MKKQLFILLFTSAVTVSGGVSAPVAPSSGETQIQYLSGHGSDDAVLWNFYCNDGRKSGAWTTIKVPSCWEQEGFGAYNYGMDIRAAGADQQPGFAREMGKYYYDFTVPAVWQGQTVRLVFEGVMTDAEVAINDLPAGPMHQGSFYEFKYDITPLLKFGQVNRLTVTVNKESANASVNRAERRGDYWNFGGIFRPVFLEILPKQFIDRTAIDAKADGSFLAEVHLGQAAARAATVTAQILDAQDHPVGAPFSADVTPGQDTAILRANERDVKLWTAETPNLYHVRFTLANDGSPAHVTTERFGFRTIEIRPGDGFYLNGTKVILKGVNRHSFWPETGRTLNKQICYDDARLIKDLNMNTVRMSHYPPDREFLEACDELGIYVLDELGGWQGAYDLPTGQKLIGEMVRRDVNHPSILFWDNGNEGGWTTANDGEFGKWDPQQRHVFHPRSTDHGVNDPHYPTYAEVVRDVNGPQVYFPTEYLHGLYDGGLGSGFHDYWDVMKNGKALGGAVFWVLTDEGVVRTDQGGKLDARGNYAPDGITGPHREKEGSFFTIKQIWSPIQLDNFSLQNGAATLRVENDYDFTNLKECTFAWEVAALWRPEDGKAGHNVLAAGEIRGPDLAPHGNTTTTLTLPGFSPDHGAWDVIYITAKDPAGRALWTWSFPASRIGIWRNEVILHPVVQSAIREDAVLITVTNGPLEMQFDKASGLLAGVSLGGKTIALANGPRFIASRHQSSARITKYEDISGQSKLVGIAAHLEGFDAIIEAKFTGPLNSATWRISSAGAKLDYTYSFDGTVDLMGVNFDYPEANMKDITWEGWGPYRVWQNRREGATYDIWRNAHNDPVPGERWEYPEFQGYFRWSWASFDTAEGQITIRKAGPRETYLGVYTPHDGTVGPLLDLPKTGIGFFDVIPAMRDKFKTQEQLGPQSQFKTVTGEMTGSIEFEFTAK